MKKILYVVLISILITGCAKKDTPKVESKKTDIPAAAAPVKYLVKVNGSPITADDVRKELEALPPQMRIMFADEKGGFNIEGFLDELVKKELLYQEARKRGLENTNEFKKKMDEFLKIVLVELLLEKEIEKKVDVSDKEVKEYYDKNKEKFTTTDPKNKKPVKLEFEKVKDIIKKGLSREKKREVFEGFVGSLKNSYTVEFNKTELSKISNSQSFKISE